MTMRQMGRTLLHSLLPSYVAPEPYLAIGNGMLLSRAYAEIVRMGRIEAIRGTNAAVKQRHFAQCAGMLPPPPPARPRRLALAALAVVAVAVGGAVLMGAADAAPSSPPPPPPPVKRFLGLF